MDFSKIAAAALSLTPSVTTAWEREVVATIQNRFGTFDFSDDQVFTLNPGLVGFPSYQRYALAPLPDTGIGHDFRVLQCLDEAHLCFIVFPTTAINPLLAPEDVRALAEERGIQLQEMVLLHLTTIRVNTQGSPMMTLNLKAPVVIDARQKEGTQVILPSNRYTTQVPLAA